MSLDQVNIMLLILFLTDLNIQCLPKLVLLTLLNFPAPQGPGQYQPQYKDGNPKYSMRIRPNTAKSEVTPGPGNYDLRKDKSLVVPSYKFGTEKKDGLDLAQTKYVPGPGNYEYKADAINKTQPKFSFGKEVRGDNRRPMTPGPGQYQYKEFLGKEAPKITMSMKLPKEGDDSRYVPGPGQYNSTNSNYYRPKSPSYKIGTAKREGIYKCMEGNPGPGQYGPDNCTNYVFLKPLHGLLAQDNVPHLIQLIHLFQDQEIII